MEGFSSVPLLTGTVLILLYTLVHATASTYDDTFAVITTIADRVNAALHSCNLDVIQELLPAFVSTRTHRLLVIVLGTEINLATFVHWLEIFEKVVALSL
jgi:hypothetical protein